MLKGVGVAGHQRVVALEGLGSLTGLVVFLVLNAADAFVLGADPVLCWRGGVVRLMVVFGIVGGAQVIVRIRSVMWISHINLLA